MAAVMRLALRLMRKQPVLTLTAVIALAVGIGLATTGFTFLEMVWRARLPFAGGERFVMVSAFEEPSGSRVGLSRERFETLRRGVPSLQHLGGLANSPQNLLLPSGEVALVEGIAITPASFSVLPYSPILGRVLTSNDATAGAAAVAVIRESLWRRHFSADSGIVGQHANFSGVQREIVGVMPDTLEFPNSPEVWLPLLDSENLRLFGVLSRAQDVALAQEQASTVSRQFDDAHSGARRLRLQVLPFIEAQSQGVAMLAGAVVAVLVMVLVVIAANVANLVLTRTLARSSELAIRSALGASRGRLIAQVFIEVLVLGGIAALIGAVASRQTLAWIDGTMTDMPFWIRLEPGPWTAAFVAIATVLSAAIGGAWPAVRATRRNTWHEMATSTQRVAAGLGVAGSAMIALQVSLSIAALYAALVVARGVSSYMEGVSTPHETRIITARLYLPDGDPARVAERAAALVESVRRAGAVEHAALATSLPRLSPPTAMIAVRLEAGGPALEARAAPVVAITSGFFATLGARVSSGRDFTAGDTLAASAPVAIVNAPFASAVFGSASPIGRQVRVLDRADADAAPVWHEIVGVVPDLGLSVGDREFAGGIYVPLRDDRLLYLTARVSGDPFAVGRTLAGSAAAVDPTIQVRDVVLLPDVGQDDRAVFAAIGTALTALGAVALALSAMGLYAILSFAVTTRTRELAIRSALGASRAQVLRNIVGRAAVPFAIGVVIGPLVGQALVTARGIFAFRLPGEAGPWAIPMMILVLFAAAVVATFVPAVRALRITTSQALRAD
jgi:predicted permease